MDYHGDYQHKSQYNEAKLLQSPWKTHFPALNNSKIVYLDSAATTQVPHGVIDSVSQYLSKGSANPGWDIKLLVDGLKNVERILG